jgi:hypothetical protein
MGLSVRGVVTPGEEGLRAHVELIPFERILRDSERKHRAFFERLGLL